MRWKPRLNLGQRLLVLLVSALVVLQLVTIWLNRIEAVSDHNLRVYTALPTVLMERVALLENFDTAERPMVARALSGSAHQFFVRPVPGLHPGDVRNPAFEQEMQEALSRPGLEIADIIIATREFDQFWLRPRPGPRGDRPSLLNLAEAPRVPLVRRAGSVPSWVTGDWADRDPTGRTPRLSDPETGPPRNIPRDGATPPMPGADARMTTVKVHTVAVRLEGQDDWTTVYRLNRGLRVAVEPLSVLLSGLAAVIIGIVAILIGRSNMRPLHDMRRSAMALGRGDRAPDVEIRGARDVQDIVRAFNSMNARVSQATDYQIGLLHSLGHDLKGPLASVGRLVTNLGPDETRAQIEQRLENVQGIIDSIISFSRAVMRDGEMETVDLSEMLHTVIDERSDLGATAEAQTPGRTLVTCRANATERCLRNLVENAIKYGGSAQARLYLDGDDAVIQIDDDGPGIPAEEIETVFQPFQRLADDVSGTGLGLAIARTIAIDQGGTLTLTNRAQGGLRAELRLKAQE